MRIPQSALYTVTAIRRIEAQAVALPGFDAWALMQRAGAAAFAMMRARWPLARRVVVVCGSGNNGGDGYVLARLAHVAGLDVHLLQVGATPTRAPAIDAVHAWRADVAAYRGGDLGDADLIVDAVFGIGLERAPSGLAAEVIDAINRHPAPCFSLDLPSGLNADSGAMPGACVVAAVTLSFVAWKRGLWTAAGPRVCGARYLDALSLPAAAFADVAIDAHLLHPHALAVALPARARDTHKGDCGHVLVIGGDHGFGGAVLIAASAALRTGAGLVSVATRAAHLSALLARQPECMVRGVDSAADLAPMLERADVIALGPGLGQGDWSIALAQAACRANKPIVLDADGLNLIAAGIIIAPKDCVLTPHPGEAARLLGLDSGAIAADRYAAVRELARRFSASVVLKGAGSLIATPGGEVVVSAQGNPGMASGGMGDALTGVIAALIAQGLSIETAASCGVLVHALAADRAAREGERGLTASDLVAQLRAVVNP